MAAAAEAEIALERSLIREGFGGRAAAEGAVPTVDLSESDEAIREAIFNAAATVGFFQVVNHGIPQSQVDAAFAAATAFFSQAKEEKERQCPFAPEHNAGYEFMKQVRPSTGTPDQKESLQTTARPAAMEGRWPQHPAGFEETARDFLGAAHELGKRLLALLEPRACPQLEPGTLCEAHNLWAADCQSTLRMLHYFPMDGSTLSSLTGDGNVIHWRAGPHTDWNCLTLLFQQPGQGGLECAPNPTACKEGGTWLRVPPQEGAIAINIGDMLSRWSDRRLLSNLHRVRLPTAAECDPPTSRYSIAVFMQADKKVVIKSATSPEITAGEFLLSRISSNFQAQMDAKRRASGGGEEAEAKKPRLGASGA